MGARYLLIEFDDEQSATSLRERIDKATRSGKRFRVVGLFAKPSAFCDCDPRKHVSGRNGNATLKRGKKFGWWVCTICKRPTPALSGLVNLIKPRDIINPRRFKRSMDWKGGPGFTAEHVVTNISVASVGPQGVDFWNSRS